MGDSIATTGIARCNVMWPENAPGSLHMHRCAQDWSTPHQHLCECGIAGPMFGALWSGNRRTR